MCYTNKLDYKNIFGKHRLGVETAAFEQILAYKHIVSVYWFECDCYI